jgi:hypothetical protein
VWLAFQYGYAMRLDLTSLEFRPIELMPIDGFTMSGDRTIIAGSRFRSTDQGATWDTIDPQSHPGMDFRSVDGGPGSLFYAASDTAGLWSSTDGGLTWSERPALRRTPDSLTGASSPLVAFDGSTVLVGASDSRTLEGRNTGLYKTTDAGATWRAVYRFNSGLVFGADQFARDESRMIFGSRSDGERFTIHMTADAGETWSDVNDGIEESNASSGVFAMSGTSVLAYIEGNRYVLYRLANASVVESESVDAMSVSLSPNPASDRVWLRVDASGQFNALLEIVDSRGRVVLPPLTIDGPAGRSLHVLDTSELTGGAPYVRVVGKQGALLRAKLIVVR